MKTSEVVRGALKLLATSDRHISTGNMFQKTKEGAINVMCAGNVECMCAAGALAVSALLLRRGKEITDESPSVQLCRVMDADHQVWLAARGLDVLNDSMREYRLLIGTEVYKVNDNHGYHRVTGDLLALARTLEARGM